LGTTDPLGCHFCCLKKKVKRWKIKKGGIWKNNQGCRFTNLESVFKKNKDGHVTAKEIDLGICNTVVTISIVSTSSQTSSQAFLPVLLSLLDCCEGRTGSGVVLVSLASYMATYLCICSLSDWNTHLFVIFSQLLTATIQIPIQRLRCDIALLVLTSFIKQDKGCQVTIAFFFF
jgi:hypothetical protein